MAILVQSNKKPSVSFPEQTGTIVTFNSQYAGLPLKSHKIALTATQSGSGTPSPDNVRTINGYSAIHIQNTCGINQWDEVWENGTINPTTGENEPNSAYIRSKNYIRITPDTNYFYKTSAALRLVYYDANKAFVGIANANNTIVLSPANAYYVRFYPNTSPYGSTYKNDISINFPATDTSYHAFVGQSVTIQIGSTIYGGEYDARTGVLTITHASVLFNGTEQGWTLNQVQSNNAVYITLSDKKVGWQTSICDKMQNVNGCWGNSTDNGLFCDHPSLKRLYFNRPDNSLSLFFTVEDWKTWLNNNNVRVCYELENPQTIQLPPCPIDTLQGVNNIWADTGETTVQYIKIGG